jgi:hypothetical protein
LIGGVEDILKITKDFLSFSLMFIDLHRFFVDFHCFWELSALWLAELGWATLENPKYRSIFPEASRKLPGSSPEGERAK